MSQPVTAAQEVAPRDGLAGAIGYGVRLPDTGDPLDPDGRWFGPNGYDLEGEPCPDPALYTASLDWCDPPRDFPAGRAFVEVVDGQHAFLVGSSVECSTMGVPLGGELLPAFAAKATHALELSRWNTIANELWTGARAIAQGWDNRRLASPDATVLSADPVSVIEAIAALEDAFGGVSAGDVQLIHVPRKLSAYLDSASVISTTPGSGRIWTANNSLVIADRGYPGTGPHGQPPTAGVCWIYATGVMSAALGPIRVNERDLSEAVDAQINAVKVRAEQPARISWVCAHLAIPVRYAPC